MLLLGYVVSVGVVDHSSFGQLSTGKELLAKGVEIVRKLSRFS
jgi:hypothetical protein